MQPDTFGFNINELCVGDFWIGEDPWTFDNATIDYTSIVRRWSKQLVVEASQIADPNNVPVMNLFNWHDHIICPTQIQQ